MAKGGTIEVELRYRYRTDDWTFIFVFWHLCLVFGFPGGLLLGALA